MDNKKINIALAGLGFGAEFIPIYLKHPNSNLAAICQRTESKMNALGDTFGIEKRYSSFNDLILDPGIDVYRINIRIQNQIIE